MGANGEGLGWDSIAVEMLKDAVDEGGKRRAEAVAVVMQEGLAHICFIGQFQTILKQKVEMSVPRKRMGGGDHDKVSISSYLVSSCYCAGGGLIYLVGFGGKFHIDLNRE